MGHPTEHEEALGRVAFEAHMVATNGEKGWIDLSGAMRRRWVTIALAVVAEQKRLAHLNAAKNDVRHTFVQNDIDQDGPDAV